MESQPEPKDTTGVRTAAVSRGEATHQQRCVLSGCWKGRRHGAGKRCLPALTLCGLSSLRSSHFASTCLNFSFRTLLSSPKFRFSPLLGHVNLSRLCLQHMASAFLSWLELKSSEISAAQQAAGISCSLLQISWMFPVFLCFLLLLSLNLCLVSAVRSEREGPTDVAEIPVLSLTRNTPELMFAVNMLMLLCLVVVWTMVSMFVTDLAGNRIPFIFGASCCEVTI